MAPEGTPMLRLPTHDVHLGDERVRLRPFTEADFDLVATWYEDPEVMYYSEGRENPHYTREEIEGIYRGVAAEGRRRRASSASRRRCESAPRRRAASMSR